MVVKVFISGLSGSKEVKKRQQRALLILDAQQVEYTSVDITEPGMEDNLEFIHRSCKVRDGSKVPLPPQFFNNDVYCGDYEDFHAAADVNQLFQFLRLESESSLTITADQPPQNEIIVESHHGIEEITNESLHVDNHIEDDNHLQDDHEEHEKQEGDDNLEIDDAGKEDSLSKPLDVDRDMIDKGDDRDLRNTRNNDEEPKLESNDAPEEQKGVKLEKVEDGEILIEKEKVGEEVEKEKIEEIVKKEVEEDIEKDEIKEVEEANVKEVVEKENVERVKELEKSGKEEDVEEEVEEEDEEVEEEDEEVEEEDEEVEEEDGEVEELDGEVKKEVEETEKVEGEEEKTDDCGSLKRKNKITDVDVAEDDRDEIELDVKKLRTGIEDQISMEEEKKIVENETDNPEEAAIVTARKAENEKGVERTSEVAEEKEGSDDDIDD